MHHPRLIQVCLLHRCDCRLLEVRTFCFSSATRLREAAAQYGPVSREADPWVASSSIFLLTSGGLECKGGREQLGDQPWMKVPSRKCLRPEACLVSTYTLESSAKGSKGRLESQQVVHIFVTCLGSGFGGLSTTQDMGPSQARRPEAAATQRILPCSPPQRGMSRTGIRSPRHACTPL